ncbi:hypothetical protein OSB04_004892 [Centaurea solstitialis]|uniref:Dof zinc finger protein n=1 Tax=Centaurea solstitialis TaxID=347529 RepID=A0AA38WFW2_9ASTR|nr:hypothetical protein OSB04_004892 [Centaurea solstitialis]
MGSTSFDQPSINPSKPTEPMVMVPSNHDHHGSSHCPRCDSTNTKFCYYNNYSLSQPRYFCKSCRRYWTKGGTLRNIPAGTLRRKIKKSSSNFKKPTTTTTTHHRRRQPHPNPHFMFENLATGGGGDGEQGRIHVEPRFAIGGDDDGIGGGFPAVVDSGGYRLSTGGIDIHGLGLETTVFDAYLTLGPWEDGEAGSGCDSDLYGLGEGGNGSSGFLLGFGSSWAGLMNGYGSSTI